MSSRERERRRCLEVLGVQEEATDDDIRKAYRRMALIFHPDKNESDDAKEKFQEISYAYKYLTEGPSAVGFEEDGHFSGHAGGHDVPIDILIRLFPWMMGDFGMARPSPFGGMFGHDLFSSHFHPSPFHDFFMDPFGGMHGFEDSDDSDEEIVIMQNGRITIVNTGRRKHGNSRRRTNRRRPQQHHHDPFGHDHFSSPFGQAGSRHYNHSPRNGNHRTQHPMQTERETDSSSNGSKHFRNKPFASSKSGHAETSSKTRNCHERDTSSMGSFSTSDTPSSSTGPDLSNQQDSKSKKAKTKTPTVVTSRKERKKQKKAAQKAASQAKAPSAVPKEGDTKDMPYVIESDSEDEISIYDNVEEIEEPEEPIKLNKKQRRKLKRERERLEKETNSGKPEEVATVPDEVVDVDDDVISISSSNDFSSVDSKSRRARKNEKKKQKSSELSDIPLFDNLMPKSHADEEEMFRIAMEMSKMEVDNIDDDTSAYQPCDSTSQGSGSIGQRSSSESQRSSESRRSSTGSQRSSLYDNPSWYADVDRNSPFAQNSPREKSRTYYNSNFDPGSYYRSSEGHKSKNFQDDKENYGNHYRGNPIMPNEQKGHPSSRSNGGYEPRYFHSQNPHSMHQRPQYTSPLERHHQKYFKTHPAANGAKHTIDLDEPDDVKLNVNDNNFRGAQNRNFHVGQVLDNSLNLPKGISRNHGNYTYKKK